MTEDNTREFQPMYPWVFVRVLQKEQVVGSIVLVEGPKQNKPTYEGIVLKTWKPTVKWFKGRRMEIESHLNPGDHVLFQHWAGVPVVGYNDKHYRIVRETEWEVDSSGGIFGIVDRDTASKEQLIAWLAEYIKKGHSPEQTAMELLERFVIVDRNEASVTLSGL